MKTLVLISTLLLSLSVQASFWIPDSSITNKKLAPAVVQKSASITFTSASPTGLPTITINRSGRPVMISLEASQTAVGTGTVSSSRLTNGTLVNNTLNFVKDLVTLGNTTFGIGGASGPLVNNFPCSAFSYVDDTIETGNKVYAIAVPVQQADSLLTINGCRLVVREL